MSGEMGEIFVCFVYFVVKMFKLRLQSAAEYEIIRIAKARKR